MKRRRDQSGAAAVEAALVLCFIVVPLTFAMISYAFMFSFRQSLSQAAAEGVRAAALAPAGTSHAAAETVATTAINDALNGLSGGVSCGVNNLACTFTWSTCGTATCVAVDVSYPYRDHPLLPSFPGFDHLLPANLAYDATAQVN
jgi:Flp pilus assembly protein TadG